MNKQKLFIPRANYVAPECEALEVRFEGMVCTSPGAPGAAGGNLFPGNIYGFGDDD